MNYKYDSAADVILIRLRSGKPEFGEQEGNIITHYSKDNKPIEIEILNASKSMFKVAKSIIAKHATTCTSA